MARHSSPPASNQSRRSICLIAKGILVTARMTAFNSEDHKSTSSPQFEDRLGVEKGDSSPCIEYQFGPDKIRIRTVPITAGQIICGIDHSDIELATDFQRSARVWDLIRQSNLIKSLLLRIPIPVFHFSTDRGGSKMINMIDLKYFKCFDHIRLPCSPITLFCGLNGVGKSSVIQAILMLRQSFDTRFLDHGRILLNGELVDLGTGADILWEDAETDQLHILLSAEDIEPQWSASIEYSHDSDELGLQTHRPNGHARISFQFSGKTFLLSGETFYTSVRIELDIETLA